ncbi:MAG: DNA replication complex GINS protein PSF1 [Marteilia pararefringens]
MSNFLSESLNSAGALRTSVALLKNLDAVKSDDLSLNYSPHQADHVDKCCEDINNLFNHNLRKAKLLEESFADEDDVAMIHIRHTIIERNVRALDIYHNHRLDELKRHRWINGPIITPTLKDNLSTADIAFLDDYNRLMSELMMSMDKNNENFDITKSIKFPRSYYVQIRCIKDYGIYTTTEGESLKLNLNDCHMMTIKDANILLNDGIIEMNSK